MVPAPQDTQSGAWEGRLAPLVGGRGAWLRPESWHHLFRETVQVLELDRERRAQWGRTDDTLQPGIACFDGLELRDDVLRSARQEPAGGHGVLNRRQLDRADQRRSEEHTSELQSPCNLVCRLL